MFDVPEWSDLPPAHQQQFIVVTEQAYPHFADWMSCFRFTELLGDDPNQARSLAVLRRLRHAPGEVPRALVPNGLDGLVRNSLDRDIASAALAELLAMQTDPAAKVRGEVLESLGRICGRLQHSENHPLQEERTAVLKAYETLAAAWEGGGPAA